MPVTTVGFEEFLEENVKGLIDSYPWMQKKKMSLCGGIQELQLFIDRAIERNVCAFDLETTGLNTRTDINGNPTDIIVGISLAYTVNEGIYVPVHHLEGAELNLDEHQVLQEVRRLCKNCVIIVHNAKFDLQMLKNYGLTIEGSEHYDDTLILAKLYDAGEKENNLKALSKKLLNQPMIDFDEATGGSKKFDMVSPKIAYVYASCDAICTMGLYEFFLSQKTVVDQKSIYRLEKKLVFCVMRMEANLIYIDRDYLQQERIRVKARLREIEDKIFEVAGKKFNIGSSQQIGKLMFTESPAGLGYDYPDKEKTAKGQFKTDTATLEKIADRYPMVKLLIEYRELEKSLGTYIENLLANCDSQGFIKLGFNQNGTDTGRFSSPGGRGLHIDGYCGVNVQSIPSNYSEGAPDIRRAMRARPGYKIVAMDFSGEELRVATNLSKESKWIEEFVNGSADLHTATAKAILKKDEVTKAERQTAKVVNFLVLYGGGPRGLAEQAKISENEARRTLHSFFEGLPTLAKWIEQERKKARKQKDAITTFGRIRPLHMFYDSGDRGLEAHADRCATNFLVQGCLQGSEKVLTDKGYLPITKVKELKDKNTPMKVWTGTSWETFDVLERGDWQFASLELKNGMTLNCDTRHEVLTVGKTGYEFKKFDDLDEKTMVCVSMPAVLEYGTWPETPKEYYKPTVYNRKVLKINSKQEWVNVSYMLGYIIGDGTTVVIDGKTGHDKKRSVTFSFGEDKLNKHYEKLKKVINGLGLYFPEPTISKSSLGVSYRVSCNSISLIELLEDFGYDFSQKRVPSRIFSCPLEMRVAFFKGYFDTDGSKGFSNRFTFHTPNLALLKDTQLLAWTLGCGSRIHREKTGAYLLNWESMEAVTGLLEKPCQTRCKYRGKDMILPKFLHGEILHKLEQKGPHTNAEKALLLKLRKNKNVSTQSMIQLLKSKNCDMPVMYYYFPIKAKTVQEEKGATYTLAVHSSLHRFDSAGIISKNTCADIMKTVMVRVQSWIDSHNLQDDIRILITMHDELVFEMRENKLMEYIPPLNNIMCMSDVLQGSDLKWPVPLTVDAEYGDTWHVDHDFFKEHPELKSLKTNVPFVQAGQVVANPVLQDLASIQEPIPAPAPIVPPPVVPAAPAAPVDLSSPEERWEGEFVKEVPVVEAPLAAIETQSVVVSEAVIVPESEPVAVSLPKNDGSQNTDGDLLVYTLKKTDEPTLRWFNWLISFLNEEFKKECKYLTSPVKTLRLCDRDGNILTVSNFKVHEEAFLTCMRLYSL